jgi:hypothetical protein
VCYLHEWIGIPCSTAWATAAWAPRAIGPTRSDPTARCSTSEDPCPYMSTIVTWRGVASYTDHERICSRLTIGGIYFLFYKGTTPFLKKKELKSHSRSIRLLFRSFYFFYIFFKQLFLSATIRFFAIKILSTLL